MFRTCFGRIIIKYSNGLLRCKLLVLVEAWNNWRYLLDKFNVVICIAAVFSSISMFKIANTLDIDLDITDFN